ncbi:MAG: hypothetical protein F4X11_01075 [Acidobacteria bacterium]|nr:hypothetical protein [Acidobacteriota bacterium]
MRTPYFAFAGVLAGALLAGGARAQDASVEESSSVNRLEDDIVEYRNDRVQIIATHYYFQGPQDPRWLLIDVGIKVTSGGSLTVARRDFSIVRPDGENLPLASQREYRRSRAELLPMLLALYDRRDAIGDYFSGGGCARYAINDFRFFVDSGIRHTVVDAFLGGCLRGDLFFASPTGTWSSGTYTLVIGGDADARLPIEIH